VILHEGLGERLDVGSGRAERLVGPGCGVPGGPGAETGSGVYLAFWLMALGRL
jgi:hypothetical protein